MILKMMLIFWKIYFSNDHLITEKHKAPNIKLNAMSHLIFVVSGVHIKKGILTIIKIRIRVPAM